MRADGKPVQGIRNIMPFLGLGESTESNRRRTGRLKTDCVTCDAGEVIDLSASGARVLAKRAWREGEVRRVEVEGPNISVRVPARCVWTRKEGKKNLIGLAFEQLGEDQHLALMALARAYAHRDTSVPANNGATRNAA